MFSINMMLKTLVYHWLPQTLKISQGMVNKVIVYTDDI